MPDRALAHALGGISEFLKLQRGFKNETADRLQKQAQHDAMLKLYGVQTRAGEAGIRKTEDEINAAPGERETRRFVAMYPVLGKAGIAATLNQYPHVFQTQADRDALRAVMQPGIEAEAAGQKLPVLQVRDLEATLGDKDFVRETVGTGQFNPEDPNHVARARMAGWGTLADPTWRDQMEQFNKNRETQMEIARLGRGAAESLARLQHQWNTEGTPAGMEGLGGLSRVADQHLGALSTYATSVNAEARAAQAQINALVQKKEANAGLFRGAQLIQENSKLDAQIQTMVKRINNRVQGVHSGVGDVDNLFTQTFKANPVFMNDLLTKLRTIKRSVPFITAPTVATAGDGGPVSF